MRTPEHPMGIQGLSPERMWELQESEMIHRQIIEWLRAIHVYGGFVTWETAHGALTSKQDFVIEFQADIQGISFTVDTCPLGGELDKRYDWIASDEAFRGLDKGPCPHPKGTHKQWVGERKADGSFLSQDTAKYPKGLAQEYARIASPRLFGKQESGATSWEQALSQADEVPVIRNTGIKEAHQTQRHLIDGGGLPSVGAWVAPPRNCSKDPLKGLRKAFLHTMAANSYHKRLVAHMESKGKSCPFTEEEILDWRHILLEEISEKLYPPGEAGGSQLSKRLKVEDKQPFLLDMIEDLQVWIGDPDTSLVGLLREGVTTGYGTPIPRSGIFPQRTTEEETDYPLKICEGN